MGDTVIELIIRIDTTGLNKYEVATALLQVADQVASDGFEMIPGTQYSLPVPGNAGIENIPSPHNLRTIRDRTI